MGLKIIHEISKDYEFDFEVVCEDGEVYFQDKSGFNFLSIKLNDCEKSILSESAAVEILSRLKDIFQSEFQDYQMAYIRQQEEFQFQSRLYEVINAYKSQIEGLEKQLETAEGPNKKLIKIQIDRLTELIMELQSKIVEY